MSSITLTELYQELIIDHGTQPRNHKDLPHKTHQAEGHNPLCGDKVTIYLEVANGIVKDISFMGEGCAISQASASLMTERLKNEPIEKVEALFQTFTKVMTEKEQTDIDLGKLNALLGVRKFPSRVKCATLAWHTMDNALSEKKEITQTE